MTTRTWDTTTPADTGFAGDGDDRIRDLKVDLKERFELDHYMDGELDPLEGDCDGYHRKATLYAQSADPTPLTGTGVIYTKVVDGVTELFFRDATTGTINQLTENGVLSLNTLANDIDANGHGITGADILESDVVTAGTLNVTTITKTGTTKVTNLNADLLDGCTTQTTLTDSDSYIPTSGAVSVALYTHGVDTATHGASGAVVGTTNTQTLSNKTLGASCEIDQDALYHTAFSSSGGSDNDNYDSTYSNLEDGKTYHAYGVWKRDTVNIFVINVRREVGDPSKLYINGYTLSGTGYATITIVNGGSTKNYGYVKVLNNF